MATSNYVAGELMDRFGVSPRWVTAGVGIFFLMPGIMWFLTRPWWDRKERTIAPVTIEEVAAHLETERFEI